MQTSYELPSSDCITGQNPQPEARLSDPSVQSDSSIAIPSEVQTQSAPLPGGEVRLVRCKPDELHLHPSCARHKLTVPAWKLSAIENLGHFAFRVPLAITRDRTILDGHARWELAKRLRRTSISCIEYDLPEAEALEWILQTHQQSSGLNAFKRICLALDLELFFQEKARANQRFGGQQKGSSKLTPAQRMDVRAQIASAAGASTGNVSKVKELAMAAHRDVLAALHNDEVSIHPA
jgi:hypothetical protein